LRTDTTAVPAHAHGIVNQPEFHMKSKAILCTVMAVTLLTGQMAVAQNRGNDQGQRNSDRRDDGRQQNQNRNNGRGNGRNNDQRWERGAGPDHSYYRGGRMPPQYRSQRYVVDDWRGHQLSAPPRGYHWVQSGGDYILVAIATGVILNLLLNNQ
jgi:Ni/Co efflux regulator RcnB